MTESHKKTVEAAEKTLPFHFASHYDEAKFKSKVKLPDGANARAVTLAVDRIVRENADTSVIKTSKQPGDPKARTAAAQATALLMPVEKDYVVEVVKEYRAWLAKQERAMLRKKAAADKDPVKAVLASATSDS